MTITSVGESLNTQMHLREWLADSLTNHLRKRKQVGKSSYLQSGCEQCITFVCGTMNCSREAIGAGTSWYSPRYLAAGHFTSYSMLSRRYIILLNNIFPASHASNIGAVS